MGDFGDVGDLRDLSAENDLGVSNALSASKYITEAIEVQPTIMFQKTSFKGVFINGKRVFLDGIHKNTHTTTGHRNIETESKKSPNNAAFFLEAPLLLSPPMPASSVYSSL